MPAPRTASRTQGRDSCDYLSQKTYNAATSATPNKPGDRRNSQITVTGNPAKKAQNFKGYSALHALTKTLTVPTSIDACMESEISCRETDCPLLVTALGTNKNNRTNAKTRPSAPKSKSTSRCFAGSISISISLASSDLGCSTSQRPSADKASPWTHAITMVTYASARKIQNIVLSRRKSRGYPKLLFTSMLAASQPAEATGAPKKLRSRLNAFCGAAYEAALRRMAGMAA